MNKPDKMIEAIKDTLLSPENLGTYFYVLENIKGFNFSIKFDKRNSSIEYFTKNKPINFESNKSLKIKVLNDTINGVNLINKLTELINIKYPEDDYIEFFLTLFSVDASESKYTECAIIMYDILVGPKQLESKYEDFDNVLDYCTLAGIKTNPIIRIATDLDSALSVPVNGDSMIPYLFNNSSELTPMYGIVIRPYKELQYKLRSKTHRLIIARNESKTETEDSEFLKFLNIESLNIVKAQNPKNLETELVYYIIEKINETKHLSVEEIKNLKSKYLQSVKDFISVN